MPVPRESSFLRAPEPTRRLPVDALIPLLGLNLGIVALVMILVWMVSVRIRDVSIVDVAWGANGALIAILTYFLTDGVRPRRLLLTGMVTFWGVRLALHIALRKRGKGEDFRYQEFRKNYGPTRRNWKWLHGNSILTGWRTTMPLPAG